MRKIYLRFSTIARLKHAKLFDVERYGAGYVEVTDNVNEQIKRAYLYQANHNETLDQFVTRKCKERLNV
jgi:hypothetical protein